MVRIYTFFKYKPVFSLSAFAVNTTNIVGEPGLWSGKL